MASNTQPIYPAKVIGAEVAFSTANTNRDGTGTLAALYSAVAAASGGVGAVVQTLRIMATGTTTAGMVRVYRHNGTTAFLVKEIAVSALTPSATVKAFTIPTSEGADANGTLVLNLLLEPGDSIRVSTHNAESFVATADIGEY
jgi:hypothetical protein